MQEVLLGVYFLPKMRSLFFTSCIYPTVMGGIVGRNLRPMKVFIIFKLSICLSSISEYHDCLVFGESVFLEF